MRQLLKSQVNDNCANNDEWNEISQWLQSLNYATYAPLFKKAGYDLWEIMLDLKTEDLTGIGIKPGHAQRIEKQLLLKKSRKVSHKLNPFKQEIIFAEKMKNQLFQTMSRVLNGLQQQLVEMNVKFAEPILLLQRAIHAEKIKGPSAMIMDEDVLFETLRHCMNDLKITNDKLWNAVNEFRNLADSQINDATEQLLHRMNVLNQQKSSNKNNGTHLLNTIVLNLDPKHNLNYNQVVPLHNHNNINISNHHLNANTIVNMNTSVPPYSVNEIEMMKTAAAKQGQGGQFDVIGLQNKMQSASGYIRNPIDILNKMKSMGLFNTMNTVHTTIAYDKVMKAKQSHILQSPIANAIVPPPPSSSPNAKNPMCSREYNAKEVVYIRQLISDYPNANTKALFSKFRQQFPCWKDDKESYNLFYQTVWKSCEEMIHRKRARQNNLNHTDSGEPKRKKAKLNHNIINVLPLRQ